MVPEDHAEHLENNSNATTKYLLNCNNLKQNKQNKIY